MIALISIPHQTPPRIHWYDGDQAIIDAAEEYAEQHGHEPPSCHGCDDPVDNAAHELADDWHSEILVRSADDLGDVREYCKGLGPRHRHNHQQAGVAALIPELEAEFNA